MPRLLPSTSFLPIMMDRSKEGEKEESSKLNEKE
jgi:hypothetical protein